MFIVFGTEPEIFLDQYTIKYGVFSSYKEAYGAQGEQITESEKVSQRANEALDNFFKKANPEKTFVFLDYHGNVISPFLKGKFMLEAFRKAFEKKQEEILKEVNIGNDKDTRKEIFDVIRSHNALLNDKNPEKVVLEYMEKLIKLFEDRDLPIALLSSTSIEFISMGFRSLQSIEVQLIHAGLCCAFKNFKRHDIKDTSINSTDLGFFMEKKDKALGFESIMDDLGMEAAIVMEDSETNINNINAVCDRSK